MFERKKHILFINKTSIKLAVSLEEKDQKTKVIAEYSWTEETLSSVFTKVTQTASKVKIVLDDDLSYTVTVPTSLDKLDRQQVESKIKEFIPEDLNLTAWDYKLYSIGPNHYIQVAALKKSFFDPFIKAIKETNLAVEAVEPISSTLSRLFSDSPEPLILVTNNPLTLTCIYKEMVLGIKKSSLEKLAKEIDQISSHLAIEFKQAIKKVIIPSELSTAPGLKTLEEKGYIIELKTIDPLISAETPKTETVADIPPPIKQTEDIKLSPSLPLESKSNKSIIWIIIPAIILILGIGAYFGYQAFGKTMFNKPSPSPTPLISPSPSPSPSPIASVSPTELKKFKLSVLNGTDRKGEAKKVSDLLTEAGFNVTKVGNAVNDYKKTEIDSKESVSQDVLGFLKNNLENYYAVTDGSTLDASVSADIVVNIGSETKKSLP